MIYEIRRADISFQKTFRTLAFDVVGPTGIEILRALFNQITPRYFIRTEDMFAHGGTSLSEVRVRLLLFNGSGEIQVTPERLHLKFNNVRVPEDIAIARDVVSLAEEALRSCLPNTTFREDVIQLTAHIAVVDKDSKGAAHILDSFSAGSLATSKLTAASFGATNVHFGLKSEIENLDQKWAINFDLTRSLLGPEALFLTGMATYTEGGTIASIDQKFAHAEKTVNTFLANLGLQSREK